MSGLYVALFTYRQILVQYLNNYPDKRGYGLTSNLLAALGKHCNQY